MCSVRLDTAHLTKFDVTDYDRSKPPQTLSVIATGVPPLKDDPTRVAVPSDPNYDCVESLPRMGMGMDEQEAKADEGYVVEQVIDVVPEEVHRGSTQILQPDDRTVTLRATATGGVCYRNASGDAVNSNTLTAGGSVLAGPIGLIGGGILALTGTDVLAEERSRDPGYARRTVQVTFRSKLEKKIGERNGLLVTSRLLCCCEPLKNMTAKVIDLALLPVTKTVPALTPETPPGPPDPGPLASSTTVLSVREANELQENITEALGRSVSAISNVRARAALDTDYAVSRVREFALTVPRLRQELTKSVDDLPRIGPAAIRRLRDAALPFSPTGEPASRLSIVSTSPSALARALGTEIGTAVRMQVHAFGLGARPELGGVPTTSSPDVRVRRKGAQRRRRR